jgi:hypothetical protein
MRRALHLVAAMCSGLVAGLCPAGSATALAGEGGACARFRVAEGEWTLYAGRTARLYRICTGGHAGGVRIRHDDDLFDLAPVRGARACADAEGARIAVAVTRGPVAGTYCLLETGSVRPGRHLDREPPARHGAPPEGAPSPSSPKARQCFEFGGRNYCE